MKRESKLGKKSSPALKIEPKKKPTSNLRNPLTELNSISTTASTTSSCSSSISIEAPSRGCLSFFRPISSSKNHVQRPKPIPRTPKSAPNSRLAKPRSKPPIKNPEKPTLQNLPKAKKENPFLKQGKNGKKPSFRSTPSSNFKASPVLVEGKLASGWEVSEHQKWPISEMMIDTGEHPDENLFSFDNSGLDERVNVTPLNKLGCGSGRLEITPGKQTIEENSAVKTTTPTTTTTPPIQASISPEIQCGSSMTSTTASCFGAGHVLSGITDKRKCRPRGILTVGEELGFPKARVSDGDSDDESIFNFLNNSRGSLIPAPSEASMHWLLSPCKEEEDQKGSHQNGSLELRRLMGPTPFHSLSSPSDVCGKSNSSSKTSSFGKRANSISPIGLPAFEGFDGLLPSIFQMRPTDDHLVSCFSPSSFAPTTSASKAVLSKEDTRYPNEFATKSSRLSLDSLGSQNAICTPQSDSSSDRHIDYSWMKNAVDNRESRFQLDSVAEIFRNTSLSPRSRLSGWDPADVLPLPGLNFPFGNSTQPSNVSDKIELQRTRRDPILGSGSSFGNMSESQMRISWREGLVSRIFDMDELDCCRWLSDEEEDVGLCDNNQSTSDFDCELDKSIEGDPSLVSATACPEFVSEEPGIKGKSKINSPSQLPSSCAESISTEGGGLIASGDSDWTLCYKNQLFQI